MNDMANTSESTDPNIIVSILDPLIFGIEGIKPDEKLLATWSQEQLDIISKIDSNDNFQKPIKYIAGISICFDTNDTDVRACISIYNYQTIKLVAVFSIEGKMFVPYVPGYLAFREVPLLMKLLKEIEDKYLELLPQVIIADGCGIWHPRSCGMASNLSILSGIPCIGVSKHIFDVENITTEFITRIMTGSVAGSFVDVVTASNKTIGTCFNVGGVTNRTVYISVGSHISLKSAKEIVSHMCQYQNNGIIRMADNITRLLMAVKDPYIVKAQPNCSNWASSTPTVVYSQEERDEFEQLCKEARKKFKGMSMDLSCLLHEED